VVVGIKKQTSIFFSLKVFSVLKISVCVFILKILTSLN
jgi:hypothetical protein